MKLKQISQNDNIDKKYSKLLSKPVIRLYMTAGISYKGNCLKK